eukprot:CAMPEP_0176480672 /NCGR_PEP_ID=MMETSP0200_2-20121128/2401_1 /TAXON_ID=947934 /ORGANISM="Chaetoceros sp., Strain GSL56" /LENGTH=870 /DNA_ID=CAMNT_0017876805 /DNA_START=314 /DNA_END=2926 /DNA_ORIENTATION=-
MIMRFLPSSSPLISSSSTASSICNVKPSIIQFPHTATIPTSQTAKRLLALKYLSSSRIKSTRDHEFDIMDDNVNVEEEVNKYRSKRRQPPDSRTATRWVIESIEKILQQQQQQQQRRRLQQEEEQGDGDKLLQILYRISKVRSKEEAQILENELIHMRVEEKFSWDVQERVLKVASMAGFVKVSLQMLDSMLGVTTSTKVSQTHTMDENVDVPVYIPSSMAYISVLNRLRKWNRVDLMRDILEKLSNACKRKEGQQMLHVVALNTYLAALCGDQSQSVIMNDEMKSYEFIQEAISLLETGVATERYSLSNPDVMSFNTVLNAVAIRRNETMMEHVMQLMQEQGVLPDVVTYNAMLKAAPTADAKILILDKILNSTDLDLVPDRYTIEMVLVPLVKQGRIATVMRMLQSFCSYDHQKSQYSLQNAFSTFLLALVKDGEIDAARAIFDRFLLSPSLEQSDSTMDFVSMAQGERDGTKIQLVLLKPITRHFNALFEGYRNLNDPYKYSHMTTSSSVSPREHARNLFHHMRAMNVSPDSFTLTLLMSMQNSTEEITETWNDIMDISDFILQPPVFHSLITAYGKVGDASSACYVFNKMILIDCLSHASNSWCVLLSALSKASSSNSREIIQCNTCSGNDLKIDMMNVNEKPFRGKDLVDLVDGYTFPQAAKIILDLMSSSYSKGYKDIIPRPNSQAYCSVASALSHMDGVGPGLAMGMFKNATVNGQRVDGRFLNAIIRCYGDNITSAVDAWKNEFRPTVLNSFTEEIDRSSRNFQKSRVYKNLVASYHGLIYVAGRAYRPDIALRLVYAMRKEGVEPTEAALNTYNSGARERKDDIAKVKLHGQYENLLLVECAKYDSKDKRRQADQRIRIIL